MNRFCNFRSLVAVLVVAAILGAPPRANATFDLALQYNLDGAGFVALGTPTSSNPGTVSGTILGINITGTVSDSLTPGVSLIDLAVSGALKQSITSLVIQGSVTDVPTQPPPQTFNADFTSSSSHGVTTETATVWANTSNIQFDISPATRVIGPLTPPADVSNSVTLSTPYSVTVQYAVGSASAGDGLSADTRVTVTSVPAPAGLVLGLTGMPFLALGAVVRRRRARAVA